MLKMLAVIKGLIIQQETDRTKTLSIQVDPSATTSTQTVLKSKQTAARILELPDTSGELVEKDYAQILTEKTIDADDNTILNIGNNEISASAAIDATKIANGSVDNTEFQALEGIESNIQDQLDTKTTVTGLIDNRLVKADGTQDLQVTGITVDDSNNVSGITDLSVSSLNVNSGIISNVANPVSPQDAATKDYVDNASPGGGANTSLSNLVAPVQPNEDFDFQGTNKITGLPVPALASDAATKAYVDSSVTSGRVVTGSYGSPILVDEVTPIPLTGTQDEDIYVEGTAGVLEFGLWNTFSTGITGTFNSIAHSPELNILVAGEISQVTAGLAYSVDGETWTFATTDVGTNATLNKVIWVPSLSKFYACGFASGVGYLILESIDGINFTTTFSQASGGQLFDICYSETLDVFVVHGGVGEYFTSVDQGATFVQQTEVAGTQYVTCVWAEELGLFVASGPRAVYSLGDKGIKYSADGFSWTTADSVFPDGSGQNQNITYSSQLGILVVTREAVITTDPIIMYSTDAINWIDCTPYTSSALISKSVWSNYHSIFIVNSQGNSVLFSYDGINWVEDTSVSFSESPFCITVNEENGFVYMLSNGTEAYINETIGANALTFATIEDGQVDGQRLVLIGCNSSQAVALITGPNMKLTKQLNIADNDVVQLRWNDGSGLWVNYPNKF